MKPNIQPAADVKPPIMELGTVHKESLTVMELVAAAKAAGKAGYPVAKLVAGDVEIFIKAIWPPSQTALFIEEIGLRNERFTDLRPELINTRQHDTSRP